MPVITGAAEYPENILEGLREKYRVYSIDAMAKAEEIGNTRVFNTIVLGMAARHMNYSKEDWENVIRAKVPPKTVDINLQGFEAGYNSVQ